jgi:hypothetical protein
MPNNRAVLWLDSAYGALDFNAALWRRNQKLSALEIQAKSNAMLQFESARCQLSASSAQESDSGNEFSVSQRGFSFFVECETGTRRGDESFIFCGKTMRFSHKRAWIRALTIGKKAEIRTTYRDAMKTLQLGIGAESGGRGAKLLRCDNAQTTPGPSFVRRG